MGLAEGMATTNTHLEGIPETEAMPMLNVLAAVSNILQRLTTCITVDAGLQMDILSLTEEHPAHVVLSLLRCAPTCDGCTGHGTDAQLCSHRAAALMWRAIGTSEVATEEVLPALLSAIEEQPAYGGFFCSGDNKAVFARAATLALWRIAPMSEWHYAMLLHSPQLFVALFLQIVTTTEQTPEDVETQSFWRACQEEHGLPSKPNRFAVQTMKALLSSLGFDKKLVALEHKWVWEKLLCANMQHYAAGLLAREMRRGLTSLCPHMASHLLSLLIGKQARWHLPALAFFVELLECLDLSIHGPSALLVVSRQLPSECRDRLRLVLRGLTVLSKEPSLAGGIRGLYQRLVEQLADADAEMVRMTLSGLTHMLQDKGLKPPSLTILKLAESLLPLFENDNSHVRLLSIQLFCKVMELVGEEGDDPLTTIVSQSLLPLFLRWHDENLHVAKVRFCVMLPHPWQGARPPPAPAPRGLQPSPGLGKGTRVPCPGLWCHVRLSATLQSSRKALLHAARFLRKRDLEQLLLKGPQMKFAERLVRTAREPQLQAGEVLCPRRSGRGAGSCAPAQPRTLLPAPGRAGRLGRCWAQGAPGRGAEPAPSIPSRHSPQLLQDESRAAEHLRWALPRLQSPQRPVREAATGIIGESGNPP
ncbi:unnamed protein product [Coccothraustes coccothraustes]